MHFENPMKPANEDGISISQAWSVALSRAEKAEAALRSIRTNAMAHGAAETQLEIILKLADDALGSV